MRWMSELGGENGGKNGRPGRTEGEEGECEGGEEVGMGERRKRIFYAFFHYTHSRVPLCLPFIYHNNYMIAL